MFSIASWNCASISDGMSPPRVQNGRFSATRRSQPAGGAVSGIPTRSSPAKRHRVAQEPRLETSEYRGSSQRSSRRRLALNRTRDLGRSLERRSNLADGLRRRGANVPRSARRPALRVSPTLACRDSRGAKRHERPFASGRRRFSTPTRAPTSRRSCSPGGSRPRVGTPGPDNARCMPIRQRLFDSRQSRLTQGQPR